MIPNWIAVIIALLGLGTVLSTIAGFIAYCRTEEYNSYSFEHKVREEASDIIFSHEKIENEKYEMIQKDIKEIQEEMEDLRDLIMEHCESEADEKIKSIPDESKRVLEDLSTDLFGSAETILTMVRDGLCPRDDE